MALPQLRLYFKPYLEYKLKQAGSDKNIFSEDSVKLIYHHSEGVPRRINRVSLKALMNAWEKGVSEIDEIIIREACEADMS